jgi:hypothetical protein
MPKHTSGRMCEISYVSGAIVGFGWNNLYGTQGDWTACGCIWENSLSVQG